MTTLAGSTVVVTRSVEQAGSLIEKLQAAGASVVHAPLVEIRSLPDGAATLGSLLGSLEANDWLAVLSPNGARAAVDTRSDPPPCRVAAVGRSTAAVLAAAGWIPDLVPERSTASDLAAGFPDGHARGRVVIAQAAQGRSTLARALTTVGWRVTTVPVYENVAVELSPPEIDRSAMADAVVFASPSAVERYVASVGTRPAVAVCIGPVTAEAASAAGFVVHTSAEPTTTALVSTVVSAIGQPEARSDS